MEHVEGGGCNNNGNNYNMLELDINQPAFGEDEIEFPMGSIEDEIEEGREAQRPKKLRLSKEQSRLLEESFRQNHTLNPVCRFPLFQNRYVHLHHCIRYSSHFKIFTISTEHLEYTFFYEVN